MCRFHRLLAELTPGGTHRGLKASRAQQLLDKLRPEDPVAIVRLQLAHQHLEDIRALDAKMKTVRGQINTLVETTGSHLADLYGIGPIIAGRILAEVETIDRFPSKDHLGVDRSLLPSRAEGSSFYERDHARPIAERENYPLAWLLDEAIVGFSSTDRIEFGAQAFMHLHILDSGQRHAGLGARFVRLSAPHYVEVLQLRRLYCQPNAFNVAPNPTLQRAGFRYVMTLETTPSAINFPQAVTRWVWEPAWHCEPSAS